MRIFAISDRVLSAVESLPFLESQIQTITERSLQVVFGLQLICSEFSVGRFRVDTVAFDPDTSSFVLIQYRQGQSFGIIDEGCACLSALRRHKADLVLKYNERMGASIGEEAFDWRLARVIFVAPAFMDYQREAAASADFALELCEAHLYANNTIGYSVLHEAPAAVSGGHPTLRERPTPVIARPTPEIEDVLEGILSRGEAPSEEMLLEGRDEQLRRAYYAIKRVIRTTCPDAKLRVCKSMLSYYAGGRGLAWVEPSGKSIILHLRKGTYEDRYGALNPDGWGGYPVVRLSVEDIDLEYVRDLLEQAYSKQ